MACARAYIPAEEHKERMSIMQTHRPRGTCLDKDCTTRGCGSYICSVCNIMICSTCSKSHCIRYGCSARTVECATLDGGDDVTPGHVRAFFPALSAGTTFRNSGKGGVLDTNVVEHLHATLELGTYALLHGGSSTIVLAAGTTVRPVVKVNVWMHARHAAERTMFFGLCYGLPSAETANVVRRSDNASVAFTAEECAAMKALPIVREHGLMYTNDMLRNRVRTMTTGEVEKACAAFDAGGTEPLNARGRLIAHTTAVLERVAVAMDTEPTIVAASLAGTGVDMDAVVGMLYAKSALYGKLSCAFDLCHYLKLLKSADAKATTSNPLRIEASTTDREQRVFAALSAATSKMPSSAIASTADGVSTWIRLALVYGYNDAYDMTVAKVNQTLSVLTIV